MIKEKLLKLLKLDGLVNALTDYVETRIELFKYEVKEDVARLMAKIFLMMVLAFSFALFIVLLSVGLAYYLGTFVGMFGGFMIIAGFYLVISLILFIFRKEINARLEEQLTELAQKKSK